MEGLGWIKGRFSTGFSTELWETVTVLLDLDDRKSHPCRFAHSDSLDHHPLHLLFAPPAPSGIGQTASGRKSQKVHHLGEVLWRERLSALTLSVSKSANAHFARAEKGRMGTLEEELPTMINYGGCVHYHKSDSPQHDEKPT